LGWAAPLCAPATVVTNVIKGTLDNGGSGNS
jgi:hypothetical protein